MITFLPYSSFYESTKVLDDKRLGKQRVEAFQILKVLTENPQSRWRNHPAVKMWVGYEDALRYYLYCCISEWGRRGFVNNMKAPYLFPYQLPKWLGFEPLHASHRANLLRKNPEHYGRFGWTEKPYNGYYWPCDVVSPKTKADKDFWLKHRNT